MIQCPYYILNAGETTGQQAQTASQNGIPPFSLIFRLFLNCPFDQVYNGDDDGSEGKRADVEPIDSAYACGVVVIFDVIVPISARCRY